MSRGNPLGRITSGISADAAALKSLEFIERHLASWRDDPTRPAAKRERDLNGQLCKFLNVAARQSEFAMVHFHHEEPQGSRHAADISANPLDGSWIEGRPFTMYEPLLVLEGKRLPTPGSNRQREYVASPVGQKPSGGVQRFKLGLHGATLSLGGMIAYVQARTCADWFVDVNQWIDDLISSGDPLWSIADRLDRFVQNPGQRVARSESVHQRRSGISPTIRLTHLWVEM